MGSVDEISQLCRLCLVKDQVNIPIFDESSDIGQIFMKINSCLPVKVSRDDNLPKKICDGCSYKLDMLYIFHNTTIDSEKQLISWLNQAGLSTISQTAVKDPLANTKPEVMVKQETFDSTDARIEGDPTGMGMDAQNYIIQQQQLPYQQDFDFGEASGSTAELTEEPAPKRAKRAAALKKVPIDETEETEDDLDAAMQITKAEEEDSEDVDQPEYVEAPSTSADDQPGPSGVGKAAVEAPMDYKLMRKYGKYHFWCRVCHEEFDQYYKFKTHVHSKLPTLEEIAIIRDSKSMEWACDLCECTFKFQSYLKRHRLRHLNPEIQCPECEQQFHDEHSLNQHLAVSHGKDTAWHCDFCPKIYKFEASLKRHRLRHFDPKIECPLCKKLFYDKFILKQHTEFVHTNRKGFVCDLCDYATGNKSTLQAHIITKHTKNYPHICDQCGKGYTKKYMLLAHRRSVHDGEHYVCEDCGKMFKYISGFNEHRKLHNETSQKKESRRCEFCGKQFRCLKEHIKNVHLGEISFVCELCGKGFYTTNSLKIHVMRKHKKIRPLKCNVCGHGHVTKKELQQHMKRRHGENDRNDDDKEKPFQCNVCGKRFKMSMSLTDHLRKHSGEKAYTCKFCEENFLSKHYLKTHKCIGLSKNFKFT